MRSIYSVLVSGAVIGATNVLPVIADTKRDDGDEPGAPLGTLNTILIFVLLPLAISGIIALLVMGPGWVSAAKKSAENGFLDDPTAGEITNDSKPAAITQE